MTQEKKKKEEKRKKKAIFNTSVTYDIAVLQPHELLDTHVLMHALVVGEDAFAVRRSLSVTVVSYRLLVIVRVIVKVKGEIKKSLQEAWESKTEGEERRRRGERNNNLLKR